MDCKEITSKSNEKIKGLKKLLQKKYRQQSNEFTVENVKTIYDALKSGYDFKELYVTKEFISKYSEKFDFLKEKSKLNKYYLIDTDLNKYYSPLDTPSGITAVYDNKSSSINKSKSILYLDGIQDSGNMGTIMRSALAFDVPNIVLDAHCVDVHNFKVINAAKDAIFKLNIIEGADIEWLKGNANDLPIYVADANNGVSLSQAQTQNHFCLVLGNESSGVSADIIKLADTSLRIDISDTIDSLNVSSAAAILLHGLKERNE